MRGVRRRPSTSRRRCRGAARVRPARDRHHVLQVVRRMAPLRPTDDPNPFVAYDAELAWAAFAEANGMTADASDRARARARRGGRRVDGAGFRVTPFARSDALSDELGFAADGGVWVKDETGNVAGSHKARHLFTILLHLARRRVARVRPVVVRRSGRPPSGNRLVRQRGAGRGDARPGRRVADRSVRAGLGRPGRRRPPRPNWTP